MFGKLTVHASGNKAVMDQIAPKEKATEIGDFVRNRLGSKTSAPAGMPATADPLDRLKKLAELRDAGVINEQEFEEKKASIMGEL